MGRAGEEGNESIPSPDYDKKKWINGGGDDGRSYERALRIGLVANRTEPRHLISK